MSKKPETKTSHKKRAKSEWKWAKFFFGKIDDVENRLDKLEESVRLIKEKLNIKE